MRTIRVGESVRCPRTGWYLELINGFASGCGWYQFELHGAGRDGESIWFCEDEYHARAMHDQYETYNSNELLEGHPDDTVMGGQVIPELDGLSFRELGIEPDEDVMGEPRMEYVWAP